MATEDLTSRETVISLLQAAGIRPSKRLGQNFLVDKMVLQRIVSEVERACPATVLEIGAGLGTLTRELARLAARVVAVEVDQRLVGLLHRTLAGHENVEIVHQDFLTFDFRQAFAPHAVTVVGNIPYRITSSILSHLLAQRESIQEALLVAQRDVVEKIIASPGPEGNALGVFVRAYAEVTIIREIGKQAFIPCPQVNSLLWRLVIRERPRFSADTETFFHLVRTLYGARRKMIRRALRDWFPPDRIEKALKAAAIIPTARGETLSFEALDQLAGVIQASMPHAEPFDSDSPSC